MNHVLDTTFGAAYRSAADDEQLRSAKRVVVVRAVGALLWALACAGYAVLVEPEVRRVVPLILGAFLVALLLCVASFRSATVLRNSWYALPFLDIPGIFAIQYSFLWVAPWGPGLTVGYAMALFLLVLMVAQLSMKTRYAVMTATMSAGLTVILQHRIGAFYLWPSAVLTFAVAAVLLGHFPRRLSMVLRDTVTEHTLRERLSHYFSPKVAERIIASEGANLPGEQREVTILVCDLRGFTAMADTVEPERVVATLSDFLARMTDVIFRHEGTLDKFTGDGVLAYFGAPISQQDHAARAISCAVDMLSTLRVLNAERIAHGQGELNLGIGVHTGRVVLGNIGPPHRFEYTVIGDAVNVACRIENLTGQLGVQVLASAATQGLAADFDWVPMGPMAVKGKAQMVDLFRVGSTERVSEKCVRPA